MTDSLAKKIGINVQGGTVNVQNLNIGIAERLAQSGVRVRILVVAANPLGSSPLKLDHEVKTIQEALRRSRNRDNFLVESRLAATPSELRRALLDVQPHVLHFSGHGSGTQGLLFVSDESAAAIYRSDSGEVRSHTANVNEIKFVTAQPLANLLRLCDEHLECVVLNACYSDEQGNAISANIPFTIGMRDLVADNVAIKFSQGFYDAIGAGKSYEMAFEWGKVAIEFDLANDEATKILILRKKGENAIQTPLSALSNSEYFNPALENQNQGDKERAIADSNEPNFDDTDLQKQQELEQQNQFTLEEQKERDADLEPMKQKPDLESERQPEVEKQKQIVRNNQQEPVSEGQRQPKTKPSRSLTTLDFIAICGGIVFLIISGSTVFGNLINGISNTPTPTISSTPNNLPSTAANRINETNISNLNSLDTSLSNLSVLEMDGSTTMVALIEKWRKAYKQVNTSYGVPNDKPTGSSGGLQNLINGVVEIAATSRKLNAKEEDLGLQSFQIGRDAIGVVVGINNPFRGNLTKAQLRDIYLGKIDNWSQVGGTNRPIKVINRFNKSGTRDDFQDIVLSGQDFGLNVVQWDKDETTLVLRHLNGERIDGINDDGINGIYYATVTQLKNQPLVRIIAIDGVSPTDNEAVESGNYPIIRDLFLAVKKKTSPAAKQFIELALSPEGQKILKEIEFVPIKFIKSIK